MNRQDYNGWTNYETWNFKLWIDNEQSSQEYWAERAAACYRTSRSTINPSFTQIENATFALSKELESYAEENTPELEPSFYLDQLMGSLKEVNYHEIAKAMLEDLELEDEDSEGPQD